MMNQLGVFIDGVQVGSLNRQDGGVVFSKAGDGAQVVSLAWPQSETEVASSGGLHPVFEQYLPEGSLRRHIEEKFHQILRGKDDLTLLRIVGSSLIGRLRFAESVDDLQAVPAVNVKDEILAGGGPDILANMLERYARFSGVAGVQPKFLVRDVVEDAPKKVTVSGATHIAKTFDPEEYPGLAMNEWICLRAASNAGLDVPEAEVSEDGRWLIVKRFDLNASGSYSAFEDMCSLAGLGSKSKYIGSYEQIAKVLTKFSSSKREDLKTFFTSVSLTCALRNGDAHRKNFAVLYDCARTVRMAPQFDIVCTESYPQLDSRAALRIDGGDKWPTAKKLKKFGVDFCLLTPKEATECLERVRDAVADSKEYLSDPRIPEATADRMRCALEDGIASLCSKSKGISL